jgi:hypothetical protein
MDIMKAKECEGVRECAGAEGPHIDIGGHQRRVSSVGAR